MYTGLADPPRSRTRTVPTLYWMTLKLLLLRSRPKRAWEVAHLRLSSWKSLSVGISMTQLLFITRISIWWFTSRLTTFCQRRTIRESSPLITPTPLRWIGIQGPLLATCRMHPLPKRIPQMPHDLSLNSIQQSRLIKTKHLNLAEAGPDRSKTHLCSLLLMLTRQVRATEHKVPPSSTDSSLTILWTQCSSLAMHHPCSNCLTLRRKIRISAGLHLQRHGLVKIIIPKPHSQLWGQRPLSEMRSMWCTCRWIRATWRIQLHKCQSDRLMLMANTSRLPWSPKPTPRSLSLSIWKGNKRLPQTEGSLRVWPIPTYPYTIRMWILRTKCSRLLGLRV